MPNQPAQETVTVSFTMPRELLSMVKGRATSELTNTSDIIRRALMNYLTPKERASVIAEMSGSGVQINQIGEKNLSSGHLPAGEKVSYRKSRKDKK